MLSYRLSPLAEKDMEAIWEYTYKRWSVNQANNYTDEIALAFEGLAVSSLQAIPCSNIRVAYKFYRQGKHVIYFRTTDYGAMIARVLHGRMLPNLHL